MKQRILFGCKKVKRKQRRNKHGHCGLMLCGQVLLTNVWRENVLQPGRDTEREREVNVKMWLYTGEPGGRKSVIGLKKY